MTEITTLANGHWALHTYYFFIFRSFSGLSWMTEHSETSVRDHLNCSVGAYRDSLQQPDILLNPQLRLILNREQKLSLRYI